MSDSEEDDNGTYRLFWVELNIPVISDETNEHKTLRLNQVKKMVVDQLANNMIEANVVDIDIDKVVGTSGREEYRFNASTALTNPCSVRSGDNLFLKRLENYGDNYPFKDDEDRDRFKEVLEYMQHEPVTRH